ncbi:hypothetical protein AVEN_116452-1 [Araneus ventricosus]|uniref:Uncharacterized protein n=1 Tax=Araneus ventricosus TaxID=182803 RepID=A0A4Y2VCB8_ARAVE|nr:hypothetical protein AVEN_116452-1 [Araneus ventricosus]
MLGIFAISLIRADIQDFPEIFIDVTPSRKLYPCSCRLERGSSTGDKFHPDDSISKLNPTPTNHSCIFRLKARPVTRGSPISYCSDVEEWESEVL